MEALLRSLKEATGPSLELDCAIFEAFMPTEFGQSKIISWSRVGNIYHVNTADGYGHNDAFRAVARTGAGMVGNALALIPPGFVLDHLCEHWRVTGAVAEKTGGATCKLVYGISSVPVKIMAEGATLELAILVAAIEAQIMVRAKEAAR